MAKHFYGVSDGNRPSATHSVQSRYHHITIFNINFNWIFYSTSSAPSARDAGVWVRGGCEHNSGTSETHSLSGEAGVCDETPDMVAGAHEREYG